MADIIGRVAKNYISSVDFMDKREILNDVLDIRGEDKHALDILEATGKAQVTTQPSFSHFVNQYVQQFATTDAEGNAGDYAGGTDTSIPVVVTDAEHLPLVGEIALFSNGNYGIVTAVDKSVPEFTALPFEGEDISAGTALQAGGGDYVIFFSQVSAEGSDAPEGKKPRWIRSENYVQNFKESSRLTDFQSLSTIEVKYGGEYYVMYKLQHDTLLRHRLKIAQTLLAGKKFKYTSATNINPFDTSDDGLVQGTQGLFNYLKNGDGDVSTTGGVRIDLGSGTITSAKMAEMSRALDKAEAPDEYWMWVGGDFDNEFEDLVRGMDGVVSGGVRFDSFGGSNPKQRALDLGVDSLRLYSRTWHKKRLKALDNPQALGATGMEDYAGRAYLIPVDQIKVDAGGTMRDRIAFKYMSKQGVGDFRYRETVHGNLAPNPSNSTVSEVKWIYQTIGGLELLGIPQFGEFYTD